MYLKMILSFEKVFRREIKNKNFEKNFSKFQHFIVITKDVYMHAWSYYMRVFESGIPFKRIVL